MVTGLFFKSLDLSVVLFASSTQAVFSFDVTNKDREAKVGHLTCVTVDNSVYKLYGTVICFYLSRFKETSRVVI